MDIGLSDDPYESFKIFQGRILKEYDKMVDEFGLTVIEATKPLLEQQEIVRKIVQPHLDNVLIADTSGWRDVLSTEGLHGRYLKVMNPEQS
jgi:hypothetical protein